MAQFEYNRLHAQGYLPCPPFVLFQMSFFSFHQQPSAVLRQFQYVFQMSFDQVAQFKGVTGFKIRFLLLSIYATSFDGSRRPNDLFLRFLLPIECSIQNHGK